jgi:hypothetical protein
LAQSSWATSIDAEIPVGDGASQSVAPSLWFNFQLTRRYVMAVYMVERSLPGITMEQLGAAQKAAIAAGKRLTAAGKPVRYIRSTFVPQESHCMCLFEASNPELVKQLNDEAKIPYTRVIEAADLTP